MKSFDEGRYNLVTRVEKRLSKGETVDEKTGRKLELAEEDMPVELEPGDEFWIWLFDQMFGAMAPDGTFPVPSEEDLVFERCGINHPENRAFGRDMLRGLWIGRAEGMNTKFERPKTPPKGKKVKNEGP